MRRPPSSAPPSTSGSCADKGKPQAVLFKVRLTRRGIRLSGRAKDTGCGRLARVSVAIAAAAEQEEVLLPVEPEALREAALVQEALLPDGQGHGQVELPLQGQAQEGPLPRDRARDRRGGQPQPPAGRDEARSLRPESARRCPVRTQGTVSLSPHIRLLAIAALGGVAVTHLMDLPHKLDGGAVPGRALLRADHGFDAAVAGDGQRGGRAVRAPGVGCPVVSCDRRLRDLAVRGPSADRGSRRRLARAGRRGVAGVRRCAGRPGAARGSASGGPPSAQRARAMRSSQR